MGVYLFSRTTTKTNDTHTIHLTICSYIMMVYRRLGRGLSLTLPNIRQVNGRDQRFRPRSRSWCQQAVARFRNSVEVKGFLDSFFIHSIFVQTLSNMSALLSPVRQEAAIQPCG